MDKNGNIPERLKTLRETSGLTRKELAEQLNGYSDEHIASIELGKTLSPKIDLVLQICGVFNIEEKWFLTGLGIRDKIDYSICLGEKLANLQGAVPDEELKRLIYLNNKREDLITSLSSAVIDLNDKLKKVEATLRKKNG